MSTPRTHYRNRKEALRAWRCAVRDLAVCALHQDGDRLPLAILAARVGVDVGGLRGLLEPDKRFRIQIDGCPRPDRETGVRPRVVVFLTWADQVTVAPSP